MEAERHNTKSNSYCKGRMGIACAVEDELQQGCNARHTIGESWLLVEPDEEVDNLKHSQNRVDAHGARGGAVVNAGDDSGASRHIASHGNV
jgi:hypothetical protein